MTFNPRVYYLFPAFPLLFAAGGVMWETWLTAERVQWVKPVYVGTHDPDRALWRPTVVPVLPVETYIRYAAAIHFQQPRIETFKLGPLPQLYADQFGWEEMAAEVARVYNGLPPDVRARTAIFGQNYGQAGAVDLFGPKYGLPKAISGHQSYFLWGPRDYTGESVIVMEGRQEAAGGEFCGRGEGGQGGASLLDALRAFRYFLLPWIEMAAEGVLAEGEELEIGPNPAKLGTTGSRVLDAEARSTRRKTRRKRAKSKPEKTEGAEVQGTVAPALDRSKAVYRETALRAVGRL